MVLILAIGGPLVACVADPAAASVLYTHGNSSCTGREDPGNVSIHDANVNTVVPTRIGTITYHQQGAHAAAAISNGLWDGGFGSSDSWYDFTPGTSGGCLDQRAWSTDSLPPVDGHHVRYWQNGSSWTVAPGGAHHDARCLSTDVDTSNQFIASAEDVASYFQTFATQAGHVGNYSLVWRLDRTPSYFDKCGTQVSDDGYTAVLTQNANLINIVRGGQG